jgi:flavin reductase (DIM6/NTAB) family NADH-FMN oxidoreductase RutF
MLSIDPKEIKTSVLHAYMLHSIAPRPIAFASTISKDGILNLSPFSFFNAFGSNPPILVFSPARRVRDNTIKHTLENIYDTMEVVINVVNYAMVQQTSLASCEFPKGVSEFDKSGFTPLKSDLIKPFRVKESPVQMECKVNQVIETGNQGGAGNLIICEILRMHISEDILDADNKIDQQKIDLVARMGGDLYCRASGKAIFKVEKPNLKLGIGFDQIPEHIRYSMVLSGNDLGHLGNVEALPSIEEIKDFAQLSEVKTLLKILNEDPANKLFATHLAAKKLISEGKTDDAWKLLLI